MADIRIHRAHKLGLAKAREVAWHWAEEVEKKFDMECTVIEGEASDTVEFTRPGVRGQLVVAADHFDLTATLGFLLGAFSKTIEAEIERNLDDLLYAETAAKKKAAARKTAAKSAATPAKKTAKK
ncbi:polyhydroxyalkanoic acid system family protein [Piscinibacter sp. XHJ-5]|uniref:polyhydroxyalkanoic acid system family protein n=1 Tax=Piscinibacter sp. XHJ-5 TaxID=3037797 RepID=UPI002452F96A|nr:polyhydroxyalkanoic acid system family protein [Piscinibacter sp. XHJ-5]